MTPTLPNGHPVKPSDRRRIRCHGVTALDHCGKPARWCEYMRWSCRAVDGSRGVSFFYFCGTCWRKKGPDGTSPAERAAKP
jgi:hypothetical protein